MAPAWLPQVTPCGQHNLLNADEPVSHACFWRYLGCEHNEGQACLASVVLARITLREMCVLPIEAASRWSLP